MPSEISTTGCGPCVIACLQAMLSTFWVQVPKFYRSSSGGKQDTLGPQPRRRSGCLLPTEALHEFQTTDSIVVSASRDYARFLSTHTRPGWRSSREFSLQSVGANTA